MAGKKGMKHHPNSKKGRPRGSFDEKDWKMLEAMTKCAVPKLWIANALGVSENTLSRRVKRKFGIRYEDLLRQNEKWCYAQIKMKQVDQALKGNVTMLIWLGKQYLGQSDQHDHRLATYDVGKAKPDRNGKDPLLEKFERMAGLAKADKANGAEEPSVH